MLTSASITNSTVNASSLTERPKRIRGDAVATAGRLISSKVAATLSPADPSHDTPDCRVCGNRRKKQHRGTFVDLAQGRVGHHHLGHGADVEAFLDRQRPWRDQLAGVRPHDGSAEYTAARAGHHLDVTAGRPLGLGSVVFAIWPTHYAESMSLAPHLFIGQSNVGKLRVGKGNPWNRIVAHLGG